MRNRNFCFTGILAIISIGQFSYSQLNSRKNYFILYLNAPSATGISSIKADEYEIGTTSWMADFGMEMKFKSLLSFSMGCGIGDIKDYNSFTQNTTMGEMESTFTTFSYQLKTGMWIPDFSLMQKRDLHIALGSNVGFEDMGARREIDNCVDCQSEKFKFKGGLFVEPELNLFFFQDIFGLGASYKYFLTSSDLEFSFVLLKLMLRVNSK